MKTKGQRKREKNSDFCGTVSTYQESTLLASMCLKKNYYELIILELISWQVDLATIDYMRIDLVGVDLMRIDLMGAPWGEMYVAFLRRGFSRWAFSHVHECVAPPSRSTWAGKTLQIHVHGFPIQICGIISKGCNFNSESKVWIKIPQDQISSLDPFRMPT